jgi:lipoprotein-releasing system permease protein
MIILIATFNIFALLSMIIMEKIKDMAVLRTMGFRKTQLKRLFLWQVGRIGLRGTIMGGVLAIGVCAWLYFFPYELPSTYYIPYLPISIEPLNIALMLILGPVISLLAGLYPAIQASRPVIAEVLRYE